MTIPGRRLVFRPGGRVDVEDCAFPEPGPRQLLVRVTRSQVSAGSELNVLRGMESGAFRAPPEGRPLGYTTAGRVEAVGEGVDDYRPGDRVLAFGSHASHVLVDLGEETGGDPLLRSRTRPDHLPEDVTDEQACFAVLGDVALHGVRRARLQIDEAVAVFGAGVVGQLTVQFARLSGAHPIVSVDLYRGRLALARQSGATHVVDASTEDAVAGVVAHTGGAGAQAVFHCTAVAQLLETCMQAAAQRGKVVLTGSPPGTATLRLQPELLRRELAILGVYETGLVEPHVYWPWTRQRNRAACLRLIAASGLRVDHLTSHVVPPERAPEMYAMLAAGGDAWMSVTFAWADGAAA